MSPNKELQEARMKGYFIEATKNILKGEGLQSANVRNIAKEAGYSYATVYNYFSDVKELIFECIKDFQQECKTLTISETENIKSGKPKIKGIINSYVKYFIQYPGIFELFYLEKVNEIGYNNPAIELVYNILDDLCKDEWNICKKNKIYTQSEIDIKKTLLRNLVVGNLLHYLNRYSPPNYVEFKDQLNKQLDYLLK